MRTSILRLTFAAAWALGLGACDVYSPDLGDDPFRCGPGDGDEPRCPEGYGPVQRTDTMCVCEEGAPADNPAFVCNDDPNETAGNNSIAAATTTTIGIGPPMWSARNMAICDAGDVDVYAIRGNVGQGLGAVLAFDRGEGMLALEIQNKDGQTLSMGERDGDDLRAALQIPAGGSYYVTVSGADDSETNNYTLSLSITDP